MKTTSLLFVALLSTFIGFAQVLPDGMAVKQSEKFSLNTGTDFSGMVVELDEGYIGYAYNGDLNTLELLKFDLNQSKTGTTKITLKSKLKNIQLEKVMYLDDKIEVLFSDYDEKEKITYLKRISVPVNSFQPSDEMEFLKLQNAEVDVRRTFRWVDTEDANHFGLITSYQTGNDELQMLVHLDFAVYTKSFEKVWENTETDLSSEGELAFPGSVHLTKDLSFLFTFVTFEINKETVSNIMDYFKQYFVVLRQGQDPKVKRLELADRKIDNMLFNVLDNGNINMVCLTSNEEEERKEYYYTVFDTASFETLVENNAEFGYPNGIVMEGVASTNDFVNRVVNEFSYVKPSFSFSELISNESGATLVAQSKFNAYGYVNGKNYLGVMVAKFNAKGELEWETGIPKIQVNKKGVDYGSISVFEHRGSIGIVTNHLPGKLNNNSLENGVFKSKKSTSVYIVMVDDGGDFRTTEVLNISNPFYQPKYSFVNNKKSVIVYGNKGTEYGFLEIVLD